MKFTMFLVLLLTYYSHVFATEVLTTAEENTLLLMSYESEALMSPVKIINDDTLTNFSKVSEGIYRGARPPKYESIIKLAFNYDVKTILNLQGGDWGGRIGKHFPWLEPGEELKIRKREERWAQNIGLDYFNIPMDSINHVSEKADRDIDAILEFLHDKSNHPVYIHCEHGADRTGLIIALYRVKYENVPVKKAYDEWIRHGHNLLHRLFTHELDEYFFEKVKTF